MFGKNNTMRSCRICKTNVRPRKSYTPNICEACQKFFRRNVGKWDELVCSTGQFNCNVESGRRWCGRCRFEKCLSNGMKCKFMKPDHPRYGQAIEDGGEEIEALNVSIEEICEQDFPCSSQNSGFFESSPAGVVAKHRNSSLEKLPSVVGVTELLKFEVDSNPFDQSLNSAERFLKASLTAYTELIGIDKVFLSL